MKTLPNISMPTAEDLEALPPERQLSDAERLELGRLVKRQEEERELIFGDLMAKRALMLAHGHDFGGNEQSFQCRVCRLGASKINVRRPVPGCTVRLHRRVLVCQGESSHYACADCGLRDADVTAVCNGVT